MHLRRGRATVAAVLGLILVGTLTACSTERPGLGTPGPSAVVDQQHRPLDLGIHGGREVPCLPGGPGTMGGVRAAGLHDVSVTIADNYGSFCVRAAGFEVGLTLPVDGSHLTTAVTRSGDLLVGIIDPIADRVQVQIGDRQWDLVDDGDFVSSADGGLVSMFDALLFAVQLEGSTEPATVTVSGEHGVLQTARIDPASTTAPPG